MRSKKLTTKQFFKLKSDFYVLDIEDVLETELLDLIDNVLKERSKGWYGLTCISVLDVIYF